MDLAVVLIGKFIGNLLKSICNLILRPSGHQVLFLKFQKLKGVIKGKTGNGGPIINGIGKVLMANFTPGKNGARSGESLADIFSSKDGALIPNKHRAFLMDTQVKYTIVSIENTNNISISLSLSHRLNPETHDDRRV